MTSMWSRKPSAAAAAVRIVLVATVVLAAVVLVRQLLMLGVMIDLAASDRRVTTVDHRFPEHMLAAAAAAQVVWVAPREWVRESMFLERAVLVRNAISLVKSFGMRAVVVVPMLTPIIRLQRSRKVRWAVVALVVTVQVLTVVLAVES